MGDQLAARCQSCSPRAATCASRIFNAAKRAPCLPQPRRRRDVEASWGGALPGTSCSSCGFARPRASTRRLAIGWPIVQLQRIARRNRNFASAASCIGKGRPTMRHVLPSAQAGETVPCPAHHQARLRAKGSSSQSSESLAWRRIHGTLGRILMSLACPWWAMRPW